VIFVETPIFTRRVQAFLPDESYRALQLALSFRPEQGALIPGGAGLRKVRWRRPGEGKRGGLRVIYYWDESHDTIYMLFVYRKSRKSDLTQDQLKALATIVREELK